MPWRLTNEPFRSIRPVQSNTEHVADITRAVLSSVYRRVAPENMSELSSTYESDESPKYVRANEGIARTLVWTRHPLTDAWKESACTVRYAFSGIEFAYILNDKLEELRTTRQLHEYVRDLMQLEEHISLVLHFVDHRVLRVFGGMVGARHEVPCDDLPRLPRYFRGAILEVTVHP